MSTDIDRILSQNGSFEQSSTSVSFMQQVYAWMGGGLLLTTIAAFLSVQSYDFFMAIVQMRWILVIAEFGVVLWLSARFMTMSATMARVLFISYSVLTGLTMSAIFAVYSPESITNVFLSCTLMFGLTSIYGAISKRNLSGVGSFMFMGLLGIIGASVVNIFLASDALSFAISIVGVVVFVGLTAYDTQQLREMSLELEAGGTVATSNLAIMGALRLYLDFINLFLMLLRLLGRRR